MIDVYGEEDIIQIRPFLSSGHPSTIDISVSALPMVESNNGEGRSPFFLFGMMGIIVAIVIVIVGVHFARAKNRKIRGEGES